jgi:putative sigma-54 modulation protein
VTVDITVSSRHVEVSPALRAAAVDKIGRLAKYLDGMERAEVHFSAEGNQRVGQREIAEVTLAGHGHLVRAKVAAADQFAAIDGAVAKLEHQLHKLKDRLVARHHGKARTGGRNGEPVGASDDETSTPRVVKTKRFVMKPMTLDEAVLQLELLGHAFFFFESAETGRAAVVYRRGDGDIGLIEPE